MVLCAGTVMSQKYNLSLSFPSKQRLEFTRSYVVIQTVYWGSLSLLPSFLLTFSSHPRTWVVLPVWWLNNFQATSLVPNSVWKGKIFDTSNIVGEGQKSWLFFSIGKSEKWLGGLSSKLCLSRIHNTHFSSPSSFLCFWVMKTIEVISLVSGENCLSHHHPQN